MNTFGFFSLVAGALQLSIPPYALRLIRRFGVQRVGWFLVTAFACLGLLHLLEPFRMLKASSGSAITRFTWRWPGLRAADNQCLT